MKNTKNYEETRTMEIDPRIDAANILDQLGISDGEITDILTDEIFKICDGRFEGNPMLAYSEALMSLYDDMPNKIEEFIQKKTSKKMSFSTYMVMTSEKALEEQIRLIEDFAVKKKLSKDEAEKLVNGFGDELKREADDKREELIEFTEENNSIINLFDNCFDLEEDPIEMLYFTEALMEESKEKIGFLRNIGEEVRTTESMKSIIDRVRAGLVLNDELSIPEFYMLRELSGKIAETINTFKSEEEKEIHETVNYLIIGTFLTLHTSYLKSNNGMRLLIEKYSDIASKVNYKNMEQIIDGDLMLSTIGNCKKENEFLYNCIEIYLGTQKKEMPIVKFNEFIVYISFIIEQIQDKNDFVNVKDYILTLYFEEGTLVTKFDRVSFYLNNLETIKKLLNETVYNIKTIGSSIDYALSNEVDDTNCKSFFQKEKFIIRNNIIPTVETFIKKDACIITKYNKLKEISPYFVLSEALALKDCSAEVIYFLSDNYERLNKLGFNHKEIFELSFVKMKKLSYCLKPKATTIDLYNEEKSFNPDEEFIEEYASAYKENIENKKTLKFRILSDIK